MPLRPTASIFCWLLLLLILLAGCGGLGGGLEKRAANYYSFMVGRAPKTPYTSFLSPAYKSTFEKDSLQALDDFSRMDVKPNERYPAAKPDDVLVAQTEQFAYTAVNPELGNAYANLEPQRWIRVGSRWYLYMGSDAEVSAYGIFPADLYPPRTVTRIGADGAQ